MQTPATSPTESESSSQEIILGGYTFKLQETGGRLVWENDTQTLRVNTKLFSSPGAAHMAGLKALGLRAGMQSSLQDPSRKQIRQDISIQPELQQLLQWQGLKKIGRNADRSDLVSTNFPNATAEFKASLDTYALTGRLPNNLSSEVNQAFIDLESQVKKTNSQGSLDHFLRYLFSGKTVWSDQLKGGRKEMWQHFIAPALQNLAETDKQTGRTEAFAYKPPQSSGLSEKKELLEEDILMKVDPFFGGYYWERICDIDPQAPDGISREVLPKAEWQLQCSAPEDEKVWKTKRKVTRTYQVGQENIIPWTKNGWPLIETLEPANTFVLMRDTQGGISIEVKDGATIDQDTVFSFDMLIYPCEDNQLNHHPEERWYKIIDGSLDPDTQLLLDDLAQSGYNNVRKGQEIVRYIRANWRYPNDDTEIQQIDSIYRPLMEHNPQALWEKMQEVGIMHCYWANILRNELCRRLGVASGIPEGPYLGSKDPRWDFAVVEAKGVDKHAWGAVWDPNLEEWTGDGQDATPPKEKSDDEETDTDQDTEPQDGDFGPTDPPDQLSEEELEELYQSLENDQDDQIEEDPEPTPEERAAEQFLQEKGVEKSTWEAFVRKVENWGKTLVPTTDSIDGKASTLEAEDRKLTEIIKLRRQIPRQKFKGPVRQSEGLFLDEPVTALVGSKSGDSDPLGWQNPHTVTKEKVEVTQFRQSFIADLSGSMDGMEAQSQHQMILQALYYDWRRQKHLSHSSVREDMTAPLSWNSQVHSFGGFATENLGANDEMDEKKLVELDQALQKADGSSSSGLYQNLKNYRDGLSAEDKRLIKEGKLVEFLTLTTDGSIPDQANCKAIIEELREMGVVVQGIGFGSGASNLETVCGDLNDATSSIIVSDVRQAPQARSQKLLKVIQEYL